MCHVSNRAFQTSTVKLRVPLNPDGKNHHEHTWWHIYSVWLHLMTTIQHKRTNPLKYGRIQGMSKSLIVVHYFVILHPPSTHKQWCFAHRFNTCTIFWGYLEGLGISCLYFYHVLGLYIYNYKYVIWIIHVFYTICLFNVCKPLWYRYPCVTIPINNRSHYGTAQGP